MTAIKNFNLSNSYLDNNSLMNDVKNTHKSIPVVHYSLFKEDEVNETVSKKYIDLEKIIHLLSNPHSSTLYERHILALKKLVKHAKKGFFMKDSLNVSKLLSLCADRSSYLPKIYLQSIIEILQICSKPFLKEKSSDKLIYHKIYVDMLSQIGYIFRLDNFDIRLQVCKSIYDLYNHDFQGDGSNDIVSNDLTYTRSAIEESDIPEILIQSFAVIGDSVELRLALLNLLELLTNNSKICCNKMLCVDSFNYLFTGGNSDNSNNLLFRSVDILWNILENGDEIKLNKQLNKYEFIGWLRDSFINQLSKGYSSYDRQLRNDILVLATLLARINPNAPFVETGFVKQLTLLATFQEVKSHNPLVKNLKMMLNHEDFELKKLLINILVLLSENKSVIPILEDGQLLLALFVNINPVSNTGNGQRTISDSNYSKPGQPGQPSVWKPAYQEELQLHALSSLTTLVPKMLSKFQDLCGVTRLLMLIEWCINDDFKFSGNGNSFHSVGGRGNKLAQMRFCMRLILRIIRANDELVNQEFVDEGCINLFIDILSNVIKSNDSNSSIDLEIQCDMLFILAALCEKDPHRKEIFGQDGVAVSIGFLKSCLKLLVKNFHIEKTSFEPNPAEANGWHKLIIAVIDSIWACIIGCYPTEHMFLDQDGAFMILDMLEILPSELYPQIIGCLVDLSENAKALSHLSTWKGTILKDKKSHLITSKDTEIQTNIAHLLCRIWREEEIRIEVERGEHSTLIDVNYPLMGPEQKTEMVIPNLEADQPSRSILEVTESLRANIYSLLSRLGYLDHPGLKIDDHITLTIIESYLEFKMGEVWTEVQKELSSENVRPISPDIEALEWISRCVEQEGIRVSKIQEELIDAMKVQDEIEEMEFYNQLRENHRQKEKNIQHFQEFIERTSNYDKLKMAKFNQRNNIDASRITIMNPDKSTVFHKTDIDNINVTKFCAECIHINSTPIHILGGTQGAIEKFGIQYSADSIQRI